MGERIKKKAKGREMGGGRKKGEGAKAGLCFPDLYPEMTLPRYLPFLR